MMKLKKDIRKMKRLLKERVEDLETIIDEFFNDIGENRPENIAPIN